MQTDANMVRETTPYAIDKKVVQIYFIVLYSVTFLSILYKQRLAQNTAKTNKRKQIVFTSGTTPFYYIA